MEANLPGDRVFSHHMTSAASQPSESGKEIPQSAGDVTTPSVQETARGSDATDLETISDDFTPELDTLCSVCDHIFRESKCLDNAVLSLRSNTTEKWTHHKSGDALRESARRGCHICSLIEFHCHPIPSGQVTVWIRAEYNQSTVGRVWISGEDDEWRQERKELKIELLNYDIQQHLDLVERQRERSVAFSTVSTRSEATMTVAKKWLESCRKRHKLCSEQSALPRLKPKRLLRVTRKNERPIIRLLECEEEGEDIEYLTLSHCWGTGTITKLGHDNYEAFRNDIPFSDLPKTFQDAVDITLRLGYNAIWIDSLCILQDDAADWAAEAPRMGVIFSNCACTIAALTSNNSNGGCYIERNPLAFVPCKITSRHGYILVLGTRVTFELEFGLVSFPRMGDRTTPVLLQRGWVIQERTLSPRTIYFGYPTIYWECCEQDFQEREPESKLSNYEADTEVGRLKTDMRHVMRGSVDKKMEWHKQWWDMISRYTECNLTYASDRWPAISGIANIFQNIVGSAICSGLWKAEIKRELLWCACALKANFNTPCKALHYPSWSWLSINDAVVISRSAIFYRECDFKMEILSLPEDDNSVVSSDLSPGMANQAFIRIKAAFFRIEAPLLPCYQDSSSLVSGILSEDIRKQIQKGIWYADFEIDQSQDVWYMHCANTTKSMHGLVVRPDNDNRDKWRRLGMYKASLSMETDKEFEGEWMTIDLY